MVVQGRGGSVQGSDPGSLRTGDSATSGKLFLSLSPSSSAIKWGVVDTYSLPAKYPLFSN